MMGPVTETAEQFAARMDATTVDDLVARGSMKWTSLRPRVVPVRKGMRPAALGAHRPGSGYPNRCSSHHHRIPTVGIQSATVLA